MAITKKRVSFFRLSLEKHFFDDKKRTTRVVPLSNEEIETQFSSIYNTTMEEILEGRKAMRVETKSSNYVIETISFSNHCAFLKIGQQNAANTVALRNRDTLESENVPMRANQLLELFTFCLIDFETGIISYIGINGAPRVSAIRAMFDNTILAEQHIYTSLAAILTDDILQTLVKKQIISKLSVTIAVPSDEILSNRMGVDVKSFDTLRNVKTRTATFSITGKRNKNIFNSSRNLAEIVADFRSQYGDNLKALKARAKDHDENSQNYDLLQYNFTKSVSLGDADSDMLDTDDFKQVLSSTYSKYREELLRYCR